MLIKLFNSLKANTISNDIKVMATMYKMVLDGLPFAVLKQAVEDIVFGKAEGLSDTFMPTTAQLRKYCEKLVEEARACVKQAKRLLDAPEETGRHKSLDADKMRRIESSLEKAQSTRH